MAVSNNSIVFKYAKNTLGRNNGLLKTDKSILDFFDGLLHKAHRSNETHEGSSCCGLVEYTSSKVVDHTSEDNRANEFRNWASDLVKSFRIGMFERWVN